jgi:hypothetical protein
VEDHTLINGTYLMVRTRFNSKVQGVFKLVTWEEGF